MGIYTAVILEPRIHRAWKLVLNNFLTNLDERWDFLIVCGLLNKEFLIELIETNFKEHKHRITIHQLNIENLSFIEHEKLRTEPYLYELIPTETFLQFQLDALISAKYKDLIYDFIQYDYVGAPWRHNHPSPELVGNGGLTLRKKSIILNIIENMSSEDKVLYPQEDILFSNKIINNKPSVDVAKLFSVETYFSEKSFGIHAPYKHLLPDELSKISEHIPELYELIELNK
jgi:hypothetical protein